MVSLKKQVSITIIATIFIIIVYSNILRASNENSSDLDIICSSQIDESYPFIVTIKSNNTVIINATVTFNEGKNFTNEHGQVVFHAPRVLPDENNTFNITATKEEYNSTTISIEILNVPQLFPTVSVSNIEEETNFTLLVLDDEGQIVNNTTIEFNNRSYKTDNNGTVTLTAPSLDKSGEFYINATKVGYIENSISVRIIPKPSLENILGFYLSIVIVIFIVVLTGLIAIIRYIRRRRINR